MGKKSEKLNHLKPESHGTWAEFYDKLLRVPNPPISASCGIAIENHLFYCFCRYSWVQSYRNCCHGGYSLYNILFSEFHPGQIGWCEPIKSVFFLLVNPTIKRDQIIPNPTFWRIVVNHTQRRVSWCCLPHYCSTTGDDRQVSTYDRTPAPPTDVTTKPAGVDIPSVAAIAIPH